jgi:hypothetical protein
MGVLNEKQNNGAAEVLNIREQSAEKWKRRNTYVFIFGGKL